MSQRAASVCLTLLVLLLWGCSSEKSEEITIRLAHGLDTKHPVHTSLVHFKKTVDALSQGQIQIEIFPSGQLGDEREIVELIQIGSLGMTKVSANTLEAFIPQMGVFLQPYLFKDQEHHWRVLLGDIGQELLDMGTQYRIRGLGYFDAGSRSFYTTEKKVETPKDLAGLKIRVMNSQTAVSMVNILGGAATPISWGELYTALQQGIVDGAENNPPSFFFSKHYEVAKYYTIDEHTSIPDVIIIGTHVWEQLNDEQQGWLKQAMVETTEFQRRLWNASTEESLAKVAAAGVEIIRPDKRNFRNKVGSMFAQINDAEMLSLINRIKLQEQRLDVIE